MSIGSGIALAGFFISIGLSCIKVEIVNNIHDHKKEVKYV